MQTELKIEGLSCGHCVNAVSNILKDLKGVTSYKVNLPNQAIIEFDEKMISIENIKQAINDSEIYKTI